MDRHPLKVLAWAAITALAVLLLCHQWSSPDIWYHLYLGQRIVETHAAQPSDGLILQQPGFVNLYWLFQLAVRGCYAAGGIPAVDVLFGAAWAVALGCWVRTSGAGRAGALGAGIALAALLLCQTRFEERPEVFSFAFAAVFACWLAGRDFADSPSPSALLGFGLMQAAWANCHGYFALGPALIALRLASFLVRPRGAPERGGRWRGWWLLLGTALAATFATPFGAGSWREFLVQANFLRHMHYSVQELLPPTRVPGHLWTITLFEACWAGLLTAAFHAAATRPRERAFAILLAAAGLVGSAVSYRNIPLLVLLSGPLVGSALAGRGRAGSGVWYGAPAALAAGLAIWVASNGFYRSLGGMPGFGLGPSPFGCPVDFSRYLAASGFHGSIFNNPGDGGYLEFHTPGLRLYADTRFVDAGPVATYFGALRDPEKLRALRARQPFDAVLVKVVESPALVASLLRDHGWRLAYADSYRAFFVDSQLASVAIAPNPVFYAGADLTQPVLGASATAWIAVLSAAGDRPRILSALGQLSRAPRVPPGVLRYALQYGRKTADAQVVAAAAVLFPSMIAGSANELKTVERLIAGLPGPEAERR